MGQNRNKLIDLFIGNSSNAIVHRILEKAVLSLNNPEVAGRYRTELTTSYEIAKKYREKINPQNEPLPEKDSAEIKDKILRRVNNELGKRISAGYKNIDLGSVEKEIFLFLSGMRVLSKRKEMGEE